MDHRRNHSTARQLVLDEFESDSNSSISLLDDEVTYSTGSENDANEEDKRFRRKLEEHVEVKRSPGRFEHRRENSLLESRLSSGSSSDDEGEKLDAVYREQSDYTYMIGEHVDVYADMYGMDEGAGSGFQWRRAFIIRKYRNGQYLTLCSDGSELRSLPNCLRPRALDGVGFLIAAHHGLLMSVQSWILHGGDPNVADAKGMTALHLACMQGHLEVVQFLLLEGQANPMAKDDRGLTPFDWGFTAGRPDIISFSVRWRAGLVLLKPPPSKSVLLPECNVVRRAIPADKLPGSGASKTAARIWHPEPKLHDGVDYGALKIRARTTDLIQELAHKRADSRPPLQSLDEDSTHFDSSSLSYTSHDEQECTLQTMSSFPKIDPEPDSDSDLNFSRATTPSRIAKTGSTSPRLIPSSTIPTGGFNPYLRHQQVSPSTSGSEGRSSSACPSPSISITQNTPKNSKPTKKKILKSPDQKKNKVVNTMKRLGHWRNPSLSSSGETEPMSSGSDFFSGSGYNSSDLSIPRLLPRPAARPGTKPKCAHRLVDHFLDQCQPHLGLGMSLSRVLLLHTDDFIKAGRFLRFGECCSRGFHVKADTIPRDSEVLFISHAWEAIGNPDPHIWQFRCARQFLNSPEGQHVQFIWLDFSCLPDVKHQNKEQEKQNGHSLSSAFAEDDVLGDEPAEHNRAAYMAAFPAAILLANHCLVIPRLTKETESGVGVTNLRGCLSRAWCRLEIFGCFLGNCQVFCYYSYENLINVALEVQRSVSSESKKAGSLLGDEAQYAGFQLAGVQALPKSMKKVDRLSLWWQILRKWWWVDQPNTESTDVDDDWAQSAWNQRRREKSKGEASDPCTTIPGAASMLLSMMTQRDHQMMSKIARMDLTHEDIKRYRITIFGKQMKLSDLAERIGEASNQEDKLAVVNMILLLQMYFMGLLSQPVFKAERKPPIEMQRHVCSKEQVHTPTSALPLHQRIKSEPAPAPLSFERLSTGGGHISDTEAGGLESVVCPIVAEGSKDCIGADILVGLYGNGPNRRQRNMRPQAKGHQANPLMFSPKGLHMPYLKMKYHSESKDK